MKTPNDVKTPDMHPNGAPAFELDVERADAWPMPPVRPYTPKPRELTLRERMELLVERMRS